MNASTRTVLITGSSTGIGRETALLFQKRGWNVIATMRTPSKDAQLHLLDRVLCVALDVTKPETIDAAISAGISKFGKIDVLVNNAGYGLHGVFEAMTPEQIKRQFDTNVFGLMAVTRAVLPHFRSRRSGTIVNIASVGGRMTFPLYSPYHSTKWAVEGFSESLAFELAPLGIRVKLVEPGPIKTDFYERSADQADANQLQDYKNFTRIAYANMNRSTEKEGLPPSVVAPVIIQAALDPSRKLRYPVGFQIKFILLLRRFLPSRWFIGIIELIVLKGSSKAISNNAN